MAVSQITEGGKEGMLISYLCLVARQSVWLSQGEEGEGGGGEGVTGSMDGCYSNQRRAGGL